MNSEEKHMKDYGSSIPRLTVNSVAAAMMRGGRRGLRGLAAASRRWRCLSS